MEAVASTADFMKGAALLDHARQAVLRMDRQVKQLVDRREQTDLTGKVQYYAKVILLPSTTDTRHIIF